MSGIYLILWNKDFPLAATSGGWPHITIAYTGKSLPREELVNIANQAMSIFALKTVTLSDPYVNTFIKADKPRHDVLLNVDYNIKTLVELFRKDLEIRYPSNNFSMNNPHVTAKICNVNQDAVDYKELIDSQGPITMTITGVTID